MGWDGRYSKGGVIINLVTIGQNRWREWAIVTTLEFFMEQRGSIGGRLCLGSALGSNAGMTVGPALGLFMGPTDVIWYGPGEGNQYGINMGVDEENILGRNKGRGGWSNTGLWPIYTSCDFLE